MPKQITLQGFYDEYKGEYKAFYAEYKQDMAEVNRRLWNLERKVDDIDERTKLIPRLYDNVDKVLGEIIENRQERAFMSFKLEDHEKRIKKIENKR